MSTLDDLIAQLHVVREQINDSLSHLAGLKSAGEEVLGTYEAVGAEGMAAQAADIVDRIEGSEATTQSTGPQIEAVITQAEALKTGGRAGESGASSNQGANYQIKLPEFKEDRPAGDQLYRPGSGRDAADVSGLLRGYKRPEKYEDLASEPTEKIGDKETAPNLGPKDYQMELHDLDADQQKNRLQRGSRNLVRKSARLEGSAKEGASIANGATTTHYNPLQHGRAEAQVPTGGTQSTSTTPDVSVPDVVSSSLIVTIAIAEGVSRITRRRKRG